MGAGFFLAPVKEPTDPKGEFGWKRTDVRTTGLKKLDICIFFFIVRGTVLLCNQYVDKKIICMIYTICGYTIYTIHYMHYIVYLY